MTFPSRVPDERRPHDMVPRSAPDQLSPLIAYALRGLQNCWMREHGRWSHIYHLDGRAQPNESIPASDVFYSLNVLLGFSRIAHLALNHDFNLPKIFQDAWMDQIHIRRRRHRAHR